MSAHTRSVYTHIPAHHDAADMPDRCSLYHSQVDARPTRTLYFGGAQLEEICLAQESMMCEVSALRSASGGLRATLHDPRAPMLLWDMCPPYTGLKPC